MALTSEAHAALLQAIRGVDAVSVPVGDTFAKIDADDVDIVRQFRWTPQRGKYATYASCRTANGKAQMHRLIIGAAEGELVDHIDGDGLNNQRHNLRICNHAQNMRNRQATAGASRFKGVHRDKGAWRAQIQVDGERIALGSFTSERSAAKAYDRAARKLFGDFARTNADMNLF